MFADMPATVRTVLANILTAADEHLYVKKPVSELIFGGYVDSVVNAIRKFDKNLPERIGLFYGVCFASCERCQRRDLLRETPLMTANILFTPV